MRARTATGDESCVVDTEGKALALSELRPCGDADLSEEDRLAPT